MAAKTVEIDHTQIVVSRQALLDVVRALDIGAGRERLPGAMDDLREPFFEDEVSSGQARTDFSLNSYDFREPRA
ncbi:hypothetical protein ATO8_18779 [Roseivivax marinus]|uniref:Uncharacterized protein n=1 Tax=Roseivivax marinus TaxID=1379903 RepID=W4HFB3_9RHOB|nr:hypothetical protein [Roseivivax marinus]ETW11093.1 hypothetical protein ATO8_18779 [Roseivivax marinus]